MVLCLVGCGSEEEGAAAGDGPMIGASLLTLQNPFFKVIGDTLTEEAKKSGYTTVVLSADNDVARQSNQVKDFIVKGCAAIVLARSASMLGALGSASASVAESADLPQPAQRSGISRAPITVRDLNESRLSKFIIRGLGLSGRW